MTPCKCPECNGTGKTVNLWWKPDGSMGPKEVVCPICGGCGELEEEDKPLEKYIVYLCWATPGFLQHGEGWALTQDIAYATRLTIPEARQAIARACSDFTELKSCTFQIIPAP